jgi:hypothetical protein
MIGEGTEMKYIVFGLDGDPASPCYAAAHNTVDMGSWTVTTVGENNPYFAFETLPMPILMADVLGANFNTAPLASADYQTNRVNVAAMYANPPTTGEANDGINVVWVGA